MGCTQALESFEGLAGRGLPLLLEQYIPDRAAGRALLIEEMERHGLAVEEGALRRMGLSDEAIRLNRAELDLADTVIAISPFVRDSLERAGVDPGRIVTAPLGVDVHRFSPGPFRPRDRGEALRVAFVGNDPLRKGLVYAADAALALGGRVIVEVFGCDRLPAGLERGRHHVLRYRGSLPQSELAAALCECHAAVMPSLWEGFGMSVYECLAAGLPTIVSRNVGAEVEHEAGAFIVPIRDVPAIASVYERLLDDEYRADASQQASRYAQGRPWGHYHQALIDGLGLILNGCRFSATQ